jgi:hypothetical protein
MSEQITTSPSIIPESASTPAAASELIRTDNTAPTTAPQGPIQYPPVSQLPPGFVPPTAPPKKEEEPAPQVPENSSPEQCQNPTFFYTQGAFWGGATLNYTIYRVLAVFGGLFALDHFYLRSPTTAIAKVILNFVTFGFWYFYDVMQSITERDDIEKYGISMPWYGPAGIGAGGFVTNENPKAANSSPFWFMLYSIGLFILPFGLDYLVAGDVPGAAYKAISTVMVFGIAYTFINIYKLLVHPEQVMCEGTTRYIPWSIFGKHKRDALFTNKLADCPAEADSSLLGLLGGIFKGLGSVPVVGSVFKVAEGVAKMANTARTLGPQVTNTLTKSLQAASAARAPQAPNIPLKEGVTQVKDVPMKGGGSAEQASLIPGFTLALLFITAIFFKGRETITEIIERGQARPPAIGTILWRKENVGDVPPPAP